MANLIGNTLYSRDGLFRKGKKAEKGMTALQRLKGCCQTPCEGHKSLIMKSLIQKEMEDAVRFAGGALLDLGCGQKPYFELFRNFVTSHIGIDMPYSNSQIISVNITGSVDALPIKAGVIDTILCTEVIEHVSYPHKVFEEINRVLRVDRFLILTAPQTYWLHASPRDFYRFTRDSLQLLAEDHGFEVIYIRSFGGIISFSADFFSKLLLLFVFEFCNSVKKRALGRASKNLSENRVLSFLAMLPQRIFIYLYFFIEKHRNRIVVKCVLDVLENWRELFALGHILVARKVSKSKA